MSLALTHLNGFNAFTAAAGGLSLVTIGNYTASPSSGDDFQWDGSFTTFWGVRFTRGSAGELGTFKFRTGNSHTTNGTAVCRLYTDSSGTASVQVGSDSDTLTITAANTDYTFTFAARPSYSASTFYWITVSRVASLATFLSARNGTFGNWTASDRDSSAVTGLTDSGSHGVDGGSFVFNTEAGVYE